MKTKKKKVACILDEFSTAGFKDYFDLVPITPCNFKEVLDETIDFLFVESAWEGFQGTWRDGLADLNHPDFEKRSLDIFLSMIISKCHELIIPTLFWNKEDPVYFNSFLYTAKKFDYVFTTDERMIPAYKEACHHERVYPLLFAANPNLHNPIDKNKNRKESICFAGSWYPHYTERSRFGIELLRAAKEFGLDIYERKAYWQSESFFPDELVGDVKGSLSFEEMKECYHSYLLQLNINTVIESETMFSRRVYEILASGRCVLSSPSKGIQNVLGDLVPVVDSYEKASHEMRLLFQNPDLRRKKEVMGLREVLQHHTYSQRGEYILESIGLKQSSEQHLVTIVMPIENEMNLEVAIQSCTLQTYENIKVIFITSNPKIQKMIHERLLDNDRVTVLFGNFKIGKYLSDYVAIFNEESMYLPNYLLDGMQAFQYCDCDIVGKCGSIAFHNEKNQVILPTEAYEFTFTAEVRKGTYVCKRQVLDGLELQKENHSNQLKIFAIDSFNYIEGYQSIPKEQLKTAIQAAKA